MKNKEYTCQELNLGHNGCNCVAIEIGLNKTGDYTVFNYCNLPFEMIFEKRFNEQ